MSLGTFGAALASTALRHCVTIGWRSVGCATDGILLKTDFAFELPRVPNSKSVSPGCRCSRRPSKSNLRHWTTWINFFVTRLSRPDDQNAALLTLFEEVSVSELSKRHIGGGGGGRREKGGGGVFFERQQVLRLDMQTKGRHWCNICSEKASRRFWGSR